MTLHLALVAGEASGDLLGAGLVRALRGRLPDLACEGIAGPEMLACGCESLYPMERLSVVGLVEGLRRAPELIPQRRRLVGRWLGRRPDVFVGVDAPDYNLGLERRLRAAGVPTVHYVSPSVWAWRQYRVRKIARAVDLLLVLFPFEVDFYARHGVPARFVGHPLADRIPLASDPRQARRELGIAEDGEWVALLPGSRTGEVERLTGPLVGAAQWLAARRPGLRFLTPAASPATRALFESGLRATGEAPAIQVFDGRSRTVMAAADVVLLASGTAALEAMLLKRPMVVTYRVSPLTYAVARRLVRVDRYSLPNLLAGRDLVPELIQHEATPERLGAAVLRYLEQPDLARELQAEFLRLHRTLRCNASEQAADAVLELVARDRR